MGGFGEVARGLGRFGSELGEAGFTLSELRRREALEKLSQQLALFNAQIRAQEFQARLRELGLREQEAKAKTPEGTRAYLRGVLGREPTNEEYQRYLGVAPPTASPYINFRTDEKGQLWGFNKNTNREEPVPGGFQAAPKLTKGDPIPDPRSSTGYSRPMLDAAGRTVRIVRDVVIPGLTPKITEGTQLTTDKDGNIIQVPTTRVTRPLAPGTAPAKPAESKIVGHRPEKLTAQEQNAQGIIRKALPMMDQVIKDLEPHKGEDGITDALKIRGNWALYQSGVGPVVPWMASYMQISALLRVMNTQQFLRGIRNMVFVQQIQQHMPNPEKDTPAFAYDKAVRMKKLMQQMQTEYGTQGPASNELPVYDKDGKVVCFTQDGKTCSRMP